MKDPISVIARTSSAAGMAMAYILGGNRFNTAFSSTNGCRSKLTGVRLHFEQKLFFVLLTRIRTHIV